MSEGRSPSEGSMLLAFLVGAAAGAAVALLTTPKSGREMRESVGDAVARAVRASRDAFDAGGDA